MANDKNQAVWVPSAQRIAEANITAFTKLVQSKYALSSLEYADLYDWSIEYSEKFWAEIWSYCGVRCSKPWKEVITDARLFPGAKWFTGARLNFAENLLRERTSREAILFLSENGQQRSLSYSELYQQVAALSGYFRQLGIKPGDRIVGLMPNIPETVVAMLAAVSVGAIWSSCSPDFGSNAVYERFSQITPKVLIACDGYFYNGKQIDTFGKVEELVQRVSTIENVVVVPYLKTDFLPPSSLGLYAAKTIVYSECLRQNPAPEIQFEQLPPDHPVYILYSSGTTGVPKCIVHGAAGTLVQHLKELVLHTDLKPEDRILYYTTCGWMMWNWLLSSLARGATVVLYDGSPLFPEASSLIELVDRFEISIFGSGAKYFLQLEKSGELEKKSFSLNKLKTILSTGSPLPDTSYQFIYNRLKKDLCLSSISGGTDIISCFALGNPTLPVYPGQLQVLGLGMKVEIFDEQCNSLRDQAGELVCLAPFPSMPVCFWNDPENSKYMDSYFNFFTEHRVWRHGDWARITPEGGLVIYGRSDATLNPGGVRIGTAEIYREVEMVVEVAESVAIEQTLGVDSRIILFVKMQPGKILDEVIKERIRKRLKENCSPRHVPAKIIAVKDIPRTITGKIVELAIKNVVHGREVKNKEALANPEALDYFKDLEELTAN